MPNQKLLNDDYVFDTKIKLESKTADGRTYTVSSSTDAKSEGVKSQLAVKQKLGTKTITTSLNTSGKATTEIKLDNVGIKGMKATLKGGVGGDKVGEAKIDYINGPAAVSTSANYYKKLVDTSATFTMFRSKLPGQLILGGIGIYDWGKGEVASYKSALCYRDESGYEIALHVENRGTKSKLSYSHVVRKDIQFATEVEYARASEKLELNMGAEVRLDADTRLKGKLNSNGVMALTCLQRVRPDTTLILSTSFDVKKSEAPKIGISIALE